MSAFDRSTTPKFDRSTAPKIEIASPAYYDATIQEVPKDCQAAQFWLPNYYQPVDKVNNVFKALLVCGNKTEGQPATVKSELVDVKIDLTNVDDSVLPVNVVGRGAGNSLAPAIVEKDNDVGRRALFLQAAPGQPPISIMGASTLNRAGFDSDDDTSWSDEEIAEAQKRAQRSFDVEYNTNSQALKKREDKRAELKTDLDEWLSSVYAPGDNEKQVARAKINMKKWLDSHGLQNLPEFIKKLTFSPQELASIPDSPKLRALQKYNFTMRKAAREVGKETYQAMPWTSKLGYGLRRAGSDIYSTLAQPVGSLWAQARAFVSRP